MHDPEILYQKFLSLWINCVVSGAFEKAAEVDMLQYQEQIRKNESSDIWDRWHKDTEKHRKNMTDIAEIVNPLRSSIISDSSSIALIYHSFSGLAHETQMARNINYLRSLGLDIELTIIYAFGSSTDSKIEKSSELFKTNKSNILFLNAKNYLEIGIILNSIDSIKKFKTAIYPSEYYLAFWTSITFKHPNQKFISMKYYPLQVGRFSDYGGGRGDDNEFYLINSQKWKQLSVLDLFTNQFSSDFNYEDKHHKAFSFGSISRIEKTTDLTYQNFILELLNKFDNLQYYYCGRNSSLNLVDNRILNNQRCKFIGWTDPNISIKFFSIYLETFPWGGGDMSLLALTTGVPYLTLDTPENIKMGIYRLLKYISSRYPIESSNEIFCSDINDLTSKFSFMAESFDYRQTVRNSWKKIIMNYQPNDINYWKNFILN